MSTARLPLSLRRILMIDATTCAGMGMLLALVPDTVASLTHIPEALLFYAGLILFPVAAYMVAVARGPLAYRGAAWFAVAGNALWIAGSLALLFGFIAPNTVGVGFILVQAFAVAVLTWLELASLLEGQRLSQPAASD